MNIARDYAARALAHRWFAFFEGTTEPLATHLDMFAEDIRLVHAGRTLLAQGKQQLASWFKSVPPEVSSHIIEQFALTPWAADEMHLNMQVAYHAVAGERLTGALIDYQCIIRFDANNAAQFSVIQKTPVAANPAQRFVPSFAANRQQALLAELLYQLHSGQFDWQAVTDDSAVVNALTQLVSTLTQRDIARIDGHISDQQLQLQLSDTTAPLCCLALVEEVGRYPQITKVTLVSSTDVC